MCGRSASWRFNGRLDIARYDVTTRMTSDRLSSPCLSSPPQNGVTATHGHPPTSHKINHQMLMAPSPTVTVTTLPSKVETTKRQRISNWLEGTPPSSSGISSSSSSYSECPLRSTSPASKSNCATSELWRWERRQVDNSCTIVATSSISAAGGD